uniref:Putative secreted protein n=1 Tax=Aedes albopictus TaxID=7160 RepID=A0A1W7R717_AEDAL
MITVTVISFLVMVPVLSEQITVTQPNVSTVGSFLTMQLRLAIRMTPRANVTVTTMGKPSGMAATAKLTPMVNISTSGFDWIQPSNMIAPMMQNE